jgi:hypothetical protein
MPFYFDPILMLIAVVCGALAMGAAALTKSRFLAGQQVPIRSGYSGREVAEAILRSADISDVQVVEHPGFLSDHYNPLTRTLALSPEVYGGHDAAAAGVAAHEVGHAIQHARGYAPMWLRSVLVPVANLGSGLAPVLIGVGFLLGAAQQAAHGGLGYTLAVAGVALFGAATLFTLVTVPVEFDASARGKRLLWELGILRSEEERSAVGGVLTAAGLTYVAAAVTSIAYLLYYAWRLGLFGGQRRD